jgi:hypothetical protein
MKQVRPHPQSKDKSYLTFVDVCNTGRYKEIPVLEAGPSGGTARCGSEIEEAYFEGIPKARDMKA